MTTHKTISKMMRRIYFVVLLFVFGIQNSKSQNTNATASENSPTKIVAKTELRKKYFGVNFSVENGFNTISNHLNFNFISSNGIHLNREMMMNNNISKLIGIVTRSDLLKPRLADSREERFRERPFRVF